MSGIAQHEFGENVQADFDRNGFVRIESVYAQSEMIRIRAALNRFLKVGVPEMPPQDVYYEDRDDKTSIKQLQRLFDYDPFFREMMFEGPVRRVAEAVLGEPARPVNMQYFNKPPGIGKPTPPHQDGYFFHLSPPQAVTGWLALEEVDEENGCLHYVRESHVGNGFRSHGPTGVLGFSQGMTDFGTPEDRTKTVAVPAQPGTLLIHHAKTVHWAGANTSPTRSRRALGFIFYGQSAQEDVASKTAYRKALDAQLMAAGSIG